MIAEFQQVKDKTECTGDEEDKGYLKRVEDCAINCNGVSSMFSYGTKKWGDSRCNQDGCKCLCELGATSSGTCNEKNHLGYDLYKYTG